MQRKYRKEAQGECPRCGHTEISARKALPSDPELSKALHCDNCSLDFCEIFDGDGNYLITEGSGC